MWKPVFEMHKLIETKRCPILFGCKDGACGACLIKIYQGLESLGVKGDDERDLIESLCGDDSEEIRLACQCIVKEDIEIDPAD